MEKEGTGMKRKNSIFGKNDFCDYIQIDPTNYLDNENIMMAENNQFFSKYLLGYQTGEVSILMNMNLLKSIIGFQEAFAKIYNGFSSDFRNEFSTFSLFTIKVFVVNNNNGFIVDTYNMKLPMTLTNSFEEFQSNAKSIVLFIEKVRADFLSSKSSKTKARLIEKDYQTFKSSKVSSKTIEAYLAESEGIFVCIGSSSRQAQSFNIKGGLIRSFKTVKGVNHYMKKEYKIETLFSDN